ncbi:MAG: flavodoxin [Bacteroidota bacterium]
MKKIALIYSFNTKKTALVAEKINKHIPEADLVNAEDITTEKFLSYENYILGVPTWFDGELPNYWDEFVPAIEDMNLKGKTFAIFGLGDQVNYSENFIDGVGIMAELLESKGGKVVGFTPSKGYEFEGSRALKNDKFLGLAVDLENQKKEIDNKLKSWTDQLKKEFPK